MNAFVRSSLKTVSLLSILFALSGCIDKPETTESNDRSEAAIQENANNIIIGYSRLRISLPVFVAVESGIFDKHGLDVELKMYETAQPLMQALVEGKIDVAGYTALPITYNAMLRSGKSLLFVSTMVEDQDHRISYLLKPNGGNIQSITDLKGKKVGILPTIAYKSWLEAMLRANNLEPGKDVIIQQIAPSLQANTLASGGVDALFTNDPVATSAIQAGVAELVSSEVELPKYLGSPFPFGSFNIDKEWAEQNPGLADKIVLSINEAINYVNNNPAESKLMMKKYLPDLFKDHVSFYPDALYLPTSESTEVMYQDIANQYLEIGIIKSDISVAGLVVN